MGIASGTTTVKATYSGLSDSASISVSATKPYKIMIASTTTTIGINGTASFTARAYYGTNSIDITTNASISWTSSNPTVATINNQGIATGKVIGVTNISATYDGLASTNTIPLTVTVPKLTKIDITPLNSNVAQFDIVPYTATGTFNNNTQRNMTNEVIWNSTDQNIAQPTITYTGPALNPTLSMYKFTPGAFIAIGNNGTAIITAASGTIIGTASMTIGCRIPPYKHIRQNVPTWMDWPYDGYTSTGAFLDSGVFDHSIGAVGCNLTVDNMVLNTLGENTDPQQLNEWLTQHGGWINDGPNWSILRNYSANIKSKIKSVEVEKPYNTGEIDTYLKNCNIVIALVAGQWRTNSKGQWVQSFPHHYVLIVGGQHGDYKIYDPWKHNSTDPTPQEENINTFGQYLKYTAITLN